MKIIALGAAAALSAVALAAPASAQTIVGPCSVNDINPAAEACAGYYAGNLLNNSSTDLAAQTAALSTLGLTWDGTWIEKIDSLGGSQTVDFNTVLNGTVWVGIHKGKAGTFNGTAFYRVDASNWDQFAYNLRGSSGAVLYAMTGGAGVPEPSTWAMMIMGVGATGFAMRRRRQLAVA